MTQKAAMPALERIESYLNALPARACDQETVGPVRLFFHRESEHPFLSYARPAAPLGAHPEPVIAAVQEAFARRGRTCRWEFIADLYPEVVPALEAGGFRSIDHYPLMTVTREGFRPEAVDGVTVRAAREDEDLFPYAEVGQRAFGGEEAPVTEQDAAVLRGYIQRGTRFFAAWVDGRPVSIGAHTPIDAATEVGGIGTLAAYRRRGLAGHVSSVVVADAFAAGCDCVFLTAGDETARRLYARLGFERIGTGIGAMEAAP